MRKIWSSREDLVHRVVELARRLEIGAERLLHHHARAFGQPGLAERPDDRAGGGRRHRQVVQPARLAPDRLLRARDARRERVGPRRHVAEPLAERLPLVVGDLHAAELPERAADVLAELLVVELAQRRTDDAVRLGHQPDLVEMEQTREQLAASEIARRSEQHEHVRLWLRERVLPLASVIDCADGHAQRDTPGPRVLPAPDVNLRPLELRRQELSGSVQRRAGLVEDRVIGLEDVRRLLCEPEGVVEENLVSSGLDRGGAGPRQVAHTGLMRP